MISNRTLFPVWGAFLILLISVCAYRAASGPGRADRTSIPAPVVVHEAAPEPKARGSGEEQTSGAAEARPGLSAVARPVTVQTRELVAAYLHIEDVRERGDMARSIASMDDAESLHHIATLFHRSRHPDEREALIAALGDTDFSTELDGKLSLLASALVGQARNVRSAALGVVGRIEDPRAVALVKKIARTDPDHEVRDAAKAFIDAE